MADFFDIGPARQEVPTQELFQPLDYDFLEDEPKPERESLLPNPLKLFQEAINADLDPSVFGEREFRKAANVIEWCRGHEFLGASTDLFPKQIQMLAHFFADICFFCSDVDYVHEVPVDDPVGSVLDRFQLLEFGVCKRCQRTRQEMLSDWIQDLRYEKYHEYEDFVQVKNKPPNEFVGVMGQRAGKSMMVSSFVWTYYLHRYLCLSDPTRYYGMPNNTVYEASFVAPTLHQINKYLWMPFRNIYASSPWFVEYRKHLKTQEKKVGVQLYAERDRSLDFYGKRLSVHMMAANSRHLRGATRVFCAIDELGHFNVDDSGKHRVGVRDGTEVFVALNNSLRTVRSRANKKWGKGEYDVIDGMMCNISSPSSVADPIMQRAEQSKKSYRIYYIHHATWEVNPLEDEETLVEEFAGDPVVLNRDFRAIPPRAVSPFFEDDGRLKELFDHTREGKLFDVTIEEGEDFSRKLLRPVPKNIRQDPYNARILAIDNGQVKDSFAACLARYDAELDGVVFEEFVEVSPHLGYYVDLAWTYNEFVIPLVKAYQPIHIGYDQWQSAYSIGDLRTNLQQDAQRYSLKWKDFENFKNAILDSRVRFPVPETNPDEMLLQKNMVARSIAPRAHFQVQLVTVNQFGKRVVKPDGGKDDLFRTAVLAHALILKNKKMYAEKAKLVHRRALKKGPVALYRSNSQLRRGSRKGKRGGRSIGKRY
jgi:hypothetical protein